MYAPLSDLDLRHGCIRLLEIKPAWEADDIHCSTIHTTLWDASGTYEALSYTWGDGMMREEILLGRDQSTLSVTSNCAEALRALRRSDYVVLIWVDAICINQEDIQERNAQVTFMSSIYSRAQCTIYLGKASSGSNLIMDYLSTLQAKIDLGESKRNPKSLKMELEVFDALCQLLARPWFTRVWVLQEVFRSPHSVLVCGDRRINWKTLGFVQNLRNRRTRRWRPEVIDWPCVVSLKTSKVLEFHQCFLALLCETRNLGATDPRDRVFALLSLFDDAHAEGLEADYALTVSEVYTKAAVAILLRDMQRLPLLLSAKHARSASMVPHLPSWVPDWNQPLPCKELQSLHTFYAGGSNQHLCAHPSMHSTAVAVKGFVLDAVSTKHPSSITSFGQYSRFLWDNTEITLTIRVFESSLQSAISQEPLSTRSHTLSNSSSNLESAIAERHPFLYAITKVFKHPIWALEGQARYPWRRPLDLEELKRRGFEDDDLIWSSPSHDSAGDVDAARFLNDKFADFPAACGLGVSVSEETWLKDSRYASWKTLVEGTLCNRVLFMTGNGYFGLGPSWMRSEDLVCIFLGAGVPYILRELKNKTGTFEFIGECFVWDIMEGEALGKFEEQDFVMV